MDKETLKQANKLFIKKGEISRNLGKLYDSSTKICFEQATSSPLHLFPQSFSKSLPNEFFTTIKDFIIDELKKELTNVENEIKLLRC